MESRAILRVAFIAIFYMPSLEGIEPGRFVHSREPRRIMPSARRADEIAPVQRGRARNPPVNKEQTVDILLHFDNTRNMEIETASNSLAALGHETRLAIFRLLVQAGPGGVSAGLICEKLELAPATLSFHLAHLSRVGLIRGRQEGRYIYYAAEYAAMDALLAFLTDNCCQGAACMPKTAAADTVAKRRNRAAKV